MDLGRQFPGRFGTEDVVATWKEAPAGARRGTARSQTILVVDDEPDILESLRLLFERSLPGVRVLLAPSGPAALAVLDREFVDLIITDYKMPGMDGLELLAKAREAAPLTPSVLITAFPDLNLAVRAINEARIQSFITKPMDPRAVVEKIRMLLRDLRSREERDQAFARSLEELRRRVRPTR